MKIPLEEKKNQNLKASATSEVTSLREEKEKKNPIIPELKTYSSVYNRSLFCLLFETGLI